MIIIDLGNDYPKWVWGTEQTWKVHDGFYGKKWIFSYVPNFGGKTPLTGDLQMYATSSAEALKAPSHGNLIGFARIPKGSKITKWSTSYWQIWDGPIRQSIRSNGCLHIARPVTVPIRKV